MLHCAQLSVYYVTILYVTENIYHPLLSNELLLSTPPYALHRHRPKISNSLGASKLLNDHCLLMYLGFGVDIVNKCQNDVESSALMARQSSPFISKYTKIPRPGSP